MNKMDIQDRYFELLKREIHKDTELDFRQYKNNYLRRRFNVRMRARDITTYERYLRLIKSKDITINVTQFFRDPIVFKLIESEILPLIIYNKVKNKRKVIRLWSAGCASGEEAYSIAIILKELLAEKFDTFLASIYGTDIDDASLADARSGRYLPRQLENVKAKRLKRYFSKDGEMYVISDEIKEILRFKKQDLFSDLHNSHFDLILCRNVMIYFTKEMQDKLFMKFNKALNSSGYLVIGKTEGLFGRAQKDFKIINSRERIYQKKEMDKE